MYQTYAYDKIASYESSKELNELKKKANNNDIIAQVGYGTACLYGIKIGKKQVIKENYNLALNYAQKSSNNGDSDGFVLLGLIYLYGKGCAKNIQSAVHSFYSALQISQDNFDAKYLLSYSFFYENFKDINLSDAINYLISSGENDQHNIKQAMFDLGKLYFTGDYININYPLSLRYLSISAESYAPARDLLLKCSKIITNDSFELEYNTKPKFIYQAAKKIISENGNKITPSSEELLNWASKRDYPPAVYEYNNYMSTRYFNDQYLEYFNDKIKQSANELYCPAIDRYGAILMDQQKYEKAMIYAKHSVYYKSNYLKNIIATIYRNDVENINPGIYFRYRKHILSYDKYDKFDLDLINKLVLKSSKNGNNEEIFNYAICLENGFGGLEKDPENAVKLFKQCSDNGYEPATRNYAYFLEFGEYAQQDLSAAIKILEKYTDLEAKSSVIMMKAMLSDQPEIPFPYNHTYYKILNGLSKDPAKGYIKLAKLCYYNKEMIPNFKLAEKFAEKGKKKYPLGLAIIAAITGDKRAGKPNVNKAEKLFKEAYELEPSEEIGKLFAEFLIENGRESEAKNYCSSIVIKPKKAVSSNSKNENKSPPAQLVNGEDLYINYKKEGDARLLERSAGLGYQIAQAEYAMHILKNQLKKEYTKAFSYLESTSEKGILTSFVLIGLMYSKGLFVKRNHQMAIQYYFKAIDKFEYQGYFGLSFEYAKGAGFKKDLYTAYRYWHIAKNTRTSYSIPFEIDESLFGENECLEILSQFEKIDVYSLNLKKANQLFNYGFFLEYSEKDYSRAFEIYEEAVEMKPKNDIYRRSLAFLGMKSFGCQDQRENSLTIFKELGNADDLYNASLIEFYLQNPMKPYYYSSKYEKLIEKVVSKTATVDECYEYGVLLYEGIEIEQNYVLAKSLFQKNLKLDHGKSLCMIGEMYENGFGFPSSRENATKNYYLSALEGDANGCFKVAQKFLKGDGVFTDKNQALYYMCQAKSKGHQKANECYDDFENQIIENVDIIDYCDDIIPFIPNILFRKISIDNIPITNFTNPKLNLKPYNNKSNMKNADAQSLLEIGLQYMKGLGVAKNYNLAYECFAKSILKENVHAHIYFAILSRIAQVSHYNEIYKYNMLKAKLNGSSLAYVEEAKVELGLYDNIPAGNKEKALLNLQKAIDAGDLYALYIRGKYFDDREALIKASAKGLGKAFYYMGKSLLDMGKINDAIPYLEKAKNQSHPKAMFYIGFAYLLKGDKTKADDLMYNGVLQSRNSILAVKYGIEKLDGKRLKIDQKVAFNMFNFAHNLKNIDGTLHYAECLSKGFGCKEDKEAAAALFDFGCENGFDEFYEPASLFYLEMKGLKNRSKGRKYANIAKKIEEKPFNKKDRFFDQNTTIDPQSSFYPWNIYMTAQRFKMFDLKKYTSNLEMATNLGIFSAIKETILHLLSSLYVSKDQKTAFNLLSHMAAINWGTAYKLLGDIYFASDFSMAKEKSYYYYKKAASLGSKSGMYKYGYVIANGIGCEKDKEKGYSIIDKSNCKYAYFYLTNYTNYTPKVAEFKPNCLFSLKNIVTNNSPSNDDYVYSARKDIKYAIIQYNVHYWNTGRQFLSPMSMIGLKYVANLGSMNASFHYGFCHYVMHHIQKAICYLKFCADRKNYHACHYLGQIYKTGFLFNKEYAKYYLSLSAIHLNNADDQWDLGHFNEGAEAERWLQMAVEANTQKYGYLLADLYLEGDFELRIQVNKNNAAYYFKRSYEYFTYKQIVRVGKLFKSGVYVDEDKQFARVLFHRGADMSSRDDEEATKLFIEMCEYGDGGPEYTPYEYVMQVADSNDEEKGHYCVKYGYHLLRKGMRTFAKYYFEKSNTQEGDEMVEYIEEIERREEEERKRREKQEEEERKRREEQEEEERMRRNAAASDDGVYIYPYYYYS